MHTLCVYELTLCVCERLHVCVCAWAPVHASSLTVLCGGDVSGDRVDLEEGGLVPVWDLVDQAVVQPAVGGLRVVQVAGRNAHKRHA